MAPPPSISPVILLQNNNNNNKKKNKKQRRQVLAPEVYQAHLESIIQRDYFPSLVVATAAANDEQRLAQIETLQEQDLHATRAIVVHKTGQEEDESKVIWTRKTPRPLHRESLSGFHERVTSQDHAEFELLQQKQVQLQQAKNQRRYRHHQQQQEQQQYTMKSAKSHASTIASNEELALASDQFNPSPNRISILQQQQSQSEIAQNSSLFFMPPPFEHNVEQTSTAAAATTTTASLTNNDDGGDDNDNDAMPPPAAVNISKKDGVSGGYSRRNNNHNTTTTTTSTLSLIEYIPKHQLEQKIDPSATRFPHNATALVVPQRREFHLEGVAHVQQLNRRRHRRRQGHDIDNESSYASTCWSDDDASSAVSDLDATPRYTLSQERQQAKRQKLREAETLVQMTPLIIPKSSSTGGDEEEDEEPIMTWGRVSSTPLVLGGGGHDGGYNSTTTSSTPAAAAAYDGDDVSVFQLPRTSVRDEAAEKARATMERRAAVAARRSSGMTTTTTSRNKSSLSKSIMNNASSSSLRSSASLSSSRQEQRPSSTTSVRSWNSLGSALRSSYGGGGGGGSSIFSSMRRTTTSQSQSSSRNSVSRNHKKDHVHRATPRL